LKAKRPIAPPSEGVLPETNPPPLVSATLARKAVVKHRRSFTVLLSTSAAGRVSGQGTVRAGGGTQAVCSDRAEIDAPGTVALRCDLSDAAQARLARRWIRFAFSVRLWTANGQVADLATVVRLPRG
jgi:hypothetical protein